MNVAALLQWYDQNARNLPWRVSPVERKRGVAPDPYQVWLSEIMLQQTGVATVKDYYARFLKKWPQVDQLANAPLEEVLKMWAGLGYYTRARNLHACAGVVLLKFDGIFPKDSKTLLRFPGIGPYTSAAIAAICGDEKVAVIDGNVERVMARFMALPKPVAQAKKEITQAVQALVPDRAGDFAQSMMDLGATICTPANPSCEKCPINLECAGYASSNPAHFPIKPPKKARPVRFGHAFVIQRQSGEILLQKRGTKGVLAHMTQVPTSEWENKLSEARFPVSGAWEMAGEVVHVFTHFRLELRVWKFSNAPDSLKLNGFWVVPGKLFDEALPSLFSKVLGKSGFYKQ